MRKWYEWVDSLVTKDNTLNNFVCMNLYEETQCLRDWLESGKWTGINYPAFDGPGYVQQIVKNNPNLDISIDTLDSWINDPEYDVLLKETGKLMHVPSVPEIVQNKFVKNVEKVFNIDWKTAKIQVTIQQPGQMFPLHYDCLKSQDFQVDYAEENSIHRWLIMLYDQQPGQTFLMSNQNVTWKAGDVIKWHHTRDSHGTANFGYYPRYTVKLTAQVLDN